MLLFDNLFPYMMTQSSIKNGQLNTHVECSNYQAQQSDIPCFASSRVCLSLPSSHGLTWQQDRSAELLHSTMRSTLLKKPLASFHVARAAHPLEHQS